VVRSDKSKLPAFLPKIVESPKNRSQIHRLTSERQRLCGRVIAPMRVLREFTQEPWRRTDDLIGVSHRVRGREPFLDSLIVVLEVITEPAIREGIGFLDAE